MDKRITLDEVKRAPHYLYSGDTPVTASGLTDADKTELLNRQSVYDPSNNCIADWVAAFRDAECRLDGFALTENEWLYLQAAQGNIPITAGLENQLVMNVEETIVYEDHGFLSRGEVTVLADRIRSLSYFEQLVLAYKAKKLFEENC